MSGCGSRVAITRRAEYASGSETGPLRRLAHGHLMLEDRVAKGADGVYCWARRQRGVLPHNLVALQTTFQSAPFDGRRAVAFGVAVRMRGPGRPRGGVTETRSPPPSLQAEQASPGLFR